MKKSFLIAAIVLTLCLAALFVIRKFIQTKPPSILLITIDTLRADHLGSYGYARNISPNLDRLAAEGVLFENTFCIMPTTLPSHGSIFFGTWPRIHGSVSNFIHFSNPSLAYFPQLLRHAGYETAAFLSAHHLGANMKSIPGFDEFHFPEGELRADVTLGQAGRWLKRERQKNFFLWVHLWDPHSPYELHPKFMEKIHPGFDNDFDKRYAFVDPGSYSRESLQKMVDLYDNEIAFTDFHLGHFLEEFRKQPESRNTIIIVTSDHGETLDELYESENYVFDHGEFLYDTQIHVPLILVFPDQRHRGLRIAGTNSLIDLLPTVLSEAKIKTPSTAQGSSLISRITKSGNPQTDALVFLQRREYKFPPRPFLADLQFGIRERNFKLLLNLPDQKTILYRNSADGVDVSLQDDRMQRLLKNRLEEWLRITKGFAANGAKSNEVSEEEAEKLRSLGYVQ
jgi:arylsulfatase A-like enzyme